MFGITTLEMDKRAAVGVVASDSTTPQTLPGDAMVGSRFARCFKWPRIWDFTKFAIFVHGGLSDPDSGILQIWQPSACGCATHAGETHVTTSNGYWVAKQGVASESTPPG